MPADYLSYSLLGTLWVVLDSGLSASRLTATKEKTLFTIFSNVQTYSYLSISIPWLVLNYTDSNLLTTFQELLLNTEVAGSCMHDVTLLIIILACYWLYMLYVLLIANTVLINL